MKPFEEQLIENVESLLSEVTEDEIEHIADILNELNPKDMAFNRLFDGKYRIVIDFPTLDTSTELGQFVDLWKNMGYTADWSKGTVSGERVLRDASPSGFADQILSMRRGTEKTQFKKINMKIGKWLTKMLGYQTKYQALRKKVADFFAPAGYDARGGFTGNQIIKALGGEDSEDLKNYYRLESYIYMMARPDEEAQVGFPPQLASVPPIEKLIKYWTHNAAFIKKNIVKAESESGKYSIIITRHPLDILRMADFENIESCHSPPSRGGSGQYYKCAVAEAHGHGAVAYVVKTEDLLHATNTSNIDSAEQEIQDGEIFFDSERRYNTEMGDLHPISRVRLRQVKYYDRQDAGPHVPTYAVMNPLEGVELAIPESRRYGAQIPGFVGRVRQWSRENQKEQMEGAPTMSHVRTAEGSVKGIDLDQFIKFGGSHEDNEINTLIELLWANKDMTYYGTVDQDTNTEDNLDNNLMGSLIDQYQDETNDIADTFNTRMRYCEIGGTAYDDDGGGVYITLEGTMTLKWPKSEWKSLPSQSRVEYVDEELSEFGMSWAELSGISVVASNVVMTFRILPQKLQGYGGEEYAWAPDRFQEFAEVVDEECDNKHSAVKQIVDYFCKREGWMEGGAIMVLGNEVENGEYVFGTPWDGEAEEGYEYGEMESVRFTADISIAYADINDALADPSENYKGVNEETAPPIAESREFRIALRMAMVTPAQEEVNKTYYPPIETSVQSVSPTEVYIRIEYYAVADDPDGLVEVLKALVEHWDEEYELHEVVKKTFIWAARQAKVASQAAPGELSLEEQKLFEIEDLLRKPIVLKERSYDDELPIPDWTYDIIYGYVIQGKQPDHYELSELKDLLNSKEYPNWLRWYKGPAYRGMIVSDTWVDEWLGGRYSDWEKRKGKLLSKHIFNLFKRFKGKIEREIKIAYGPGMKGRAGQTLARDEKPMESWSRSYSVAKSYAVPSGEDFYHQQSGFGTGLRSYLTDKSWAPGRAGVLSIILESDGSAAPSGMAGSDEGAFLDMEPLYKLPGLAPEARIQEVPSIVPFVTITRIHIPYEDFKRSYDRATKKWKPEERERVSPYIKEAAEKAGIILF